MVITPDFLSGDESSILSICSNHEAIGWQHLPKVELKYTLYGKAGIGSNPIMIKLGISSAVELSTVNRVVLGSNPRYPAIRIG